jgi:hypothetical protein
MCDHSQGGTESDASSVTGCTGLNPRTLVPNTSSQTILVYVS